MARGKSCKTGSFECTYNCIYRPERKRFVTRQVFPSLSFSLSHFSNVACRSHTYVLCPFSRGSSFFSILFVNQECRVVIYILLSKTEYRLGCEPFSLSLSLSLSLSFFLSPCPWLNTAVIHYLNVGGFRILCSFKNKQRSRDFSADVPIVMLYCFDAT
jgi:hypothetical protein